MVRIWVSRALRYYLELVNYQRVASPLERSMVRIGVSGALKHYRQLVNYQRVASPLERSQWCAYEFHERSNTALNQLTIKE